MGLEYLAGFRARRLEGAGSAQRTEAGHTVAAAVADGHRVLGRAGDRAGGQVNAELVFGIAVGALRTGGTLARMSWPRAVCSSRVAPSA